MMICIRQVAAVKMIGSLGQTPADLDADSPCASLADLSSMVSFIHLAHCCWPNGSYIRPVGYLASLMM